jgi:serine protease 16
MCEDFFFFFFSFLILLYVSRTHITAPAPTHSQTHTHTHTIAHTHTTKITQSFAQSKHTLIHGWALDPPRAHAGYGKSWPTDDATVSSMRYISSRQALADAAAFLPWIRTKAGVSPDARAVVFGCSYSGALSSWFRLLYPDLVVASIAPSGPVEAKLDYAGFFRQFPTSAGPECAANVAQTTAAVEALLAQGNTAELCTAFNCCPGETLEDPMDQMLFKFSLTGTIGSADQMSNPPTFSLNGTCDILADQSQGPINALVKAFNYVNAHPDDVSVTAGCNSFSYNDTIASMTGTTTAGNADGGRSWYWQKCTEFGYFKGYEDASAIFPSVPYTFPLGMCAAVFGIPGMTPNIDATNAFYGGKALNATNVLFTNGLLDTWHLLSITLPNGNGVGAANYEAGHCATLIATADNDPPSLTAARAQVAQFLTTVLAP